MWRCESDFSLGRKNSLDVVSYPATSKVFIWNKVRSLWRVFWVSEYLCKNLFIRQVGLRVGALAFDLSDYVNGLNRVSRRRPGTYSVIQ